MTPGWIHPFEVEVLSSDTALDHDSVVDLSQIRVVDIDERIEGNVGSLSSETMGEIDTAIENSLGL